MHSKRQSICLNPEVMERNSLSGLTVSQWPVLHYTDNEANKEVVSINN